MTMRTETDLDPRDPKRLTAALRIVLRRYGAQVRRRPAMAAGALLLPALGDVLTLYAPPLVVAKLLGRFARNEQRAAADLLPYVVAFAVLWLAGQASWRIAVALIARVEIRGMKALYIEAMDELLARDLAFFHNNHAGSLTKRALGVLAVLAAVAAVVTYPTNLFGEDSGRGWAIAALVCSVVLLGICTFQHVCWLRAMAVWRDQSQTDVRQLTTFTYAAQLVSYLVVAVAVWVGITAIVIAGWFATASILLLLTLAFMLVAQVLRRRSVRTSRGPPGRRRPTCGGSWRGRTLAERLERPAAPLRFVCPPCAQNRVRARWRAETQLVRAKYCDQGRDPPGAVSECDRRQEVSRALSSAGATKR